MKNFIFRLVKAYLSELTIVINNCLDKGVFPDDLEIADATHVFKKEDSLHKISYLHCVEGVQIRTRRNSLFGYFLRNACC